jgi:hypothetical protein
MFEPIKSLIARRRVIRELDTFGRRDLDDLGINSHALRSLAFTPQHVVARQTTMARRFGVGDAAFTRSRQDLAAALERCVNCRSVARCDAFLVDPSAGQSRAGFCPNSALYRDLSQAETA